MSEIIQCQRLQEVDWPSKAVVIVDQGLPDHLRSSLPSPTIEVDGGEAIKDWQCIAQLAERVLALRSTRPLHLVAVGGGAVGDAVGFLASILWRGVRLWHVPTTLLAMVDSAHGGKTAVNLARSKNQLGTFYPANTVIISQDFLETLPLELREQGFVELLKILWLRRPHHLNSLDEHLPTLLDDPISDHRQLWTDLLDASIGAKYDVVQADPTETTGHRRILNLGHTAGHGIEAITDLSHGHAIAWGLAACALLSHRRADLDAPQTERLLDHLRPFLRPLPPTLDDRDRQAFIRRLQRDKKWVDGRLISILLDAPGQPVQVDDITPEMWWDALLDIRQILNHDALHVAPRVRHKPRIPSLPVDKSHANRILVAAHLRAGDSDIEWPSSALPQDVVAMRRALRRLKDAQEDQPVNISAGQAGTTGRFLMALACQRPGPTHLHFGAQLRDRPHGPLIDALRKGGATIDTTDRGFTIRGWTSPPTALRVDPSTSSQFASALALLSAAGHPLELQLSAPMASRTYFAMTLDVLRHAGVAVDMSRAPSAISFTPTDALRRPWQPALRDDTSSAALWHVLATRHPHIQPPPIPADEHADAIIEDILDDLHRQGPGANHRIALTDAPDLAPILTALATQILPALTLTDAPHLRHKESNRIDTLSQSFANLGIEVQPRPDGLHVPSGSQPPSSQDAFDSAHDHRLAMAALVIASPRFPVTISRARCVDKSYPDLWRQLRRQGFQLDWSLDHPLT